MQNPLKCYLFVLLTYWLGHSSLAYAQSAVEFEGSNAPTDAAFDPGLLSFSVKFHNILSQHSIMFAPVLPDENLGFHIENGHNKATFHVEVPQGKLKSGKRNNWSWRAPKIPGLYPVTIIREGTGEQMRVQVFVQVPAEKIKNGVLNGYRIGTYPKPRDREALDLPPRGFIEVTRQNEDTLVSPHFSLKQFVCKQKGGYPKYLVLNPRLLTKLEVLLQDVNLMGIRADGFEVMSGYRTPYYNASIGNVQYSRHVWGGAADIFIDVSPKDRVMDDLNRDGTVSRADATHLYLIADTFNQRHPHLKLEGGVGEYNSTPAHGPFVHVDVRGKPARWGHSPSAGRK